MNITSAMYKTSVVKAQDILCDGVPEFAFVGRSNVGKSSLINMLVGQKKLAKTSSAPGLTKMINYFDINSAFRFVDLPGYGYAKVGRKELDVWAGLMGEYLTKSPSLECVFVLLDIRHQPTELDDQMVEFLLYHKIPFAILATKCDKLSRAAQNKQVEILAQTLRLRKEMIILISAQSRLGRDKVLDFIEGKLVADK